MSGKPFSSAIYTGTLRHRRRRPLANRFRYGVYQLLIDLDEVEALAGRLWFFGHNRFNLFSFYDRDHMGASGVPLRSKLARWLAARGVELGASRVMLLTNPRVLGYVFNPVSYYYVFGANDELRFVVAEINNTFGETYCYLLDDLKPRGGRALVARRRKVFHVSPFIEIDGIDYDWIMTPPGDRLTVHIDEFRGEDKFFDATLSLKRNALTAGRLAWTFVRYPHMTARTIFLIHWQALKLWWRGAPLHRKPEPPPQAWRTHG
ncbi:MAG: DUF1365 domain-containing protein [Gemmatimonadetes bacterium]|uniref:DUF1365 domain-containing protein n=1 Tax=Candidatus Kutchimonas denitrificans TaxID=3056748 RepID=A0AAE4Z5Y6_9BACT|nr:DUF1365 domain-containing protein [Gemmatimonadota bacterium]NIR74435.1 DUF1365 domain-containing protein [Candidatus Kutchimonas denitrificans]NIS00831.1 DUF1365 domain-containing protein [Gemmatimonadota bacterium]NIT66454.1 DUF1365 domain-containing protein [Gemmatimonadota bacterium]NIU52085.1 DUF1365 family protein [Gemmatimonadota bacterium]